MQKFYIKDKKKRKYTKKIKDVRSFSIPTVFYGMLPLLIILISFTATYFISSSFKISLSHIKFTFRSLDESSLSINTINYIYDRISHYLIQTSTFTEINLFKILKDIVVLFVNNLQSLLKSYTQIITFSRINVLNNLVIWEEICSNFIIKQSTSFFIAVKNETFFLISTIAAFHTQINFSASINSYKILDKSFTYVALQILLYSKKIILLSSLYSYVNLYNYAKSAIGIYIISSFYIYSLSDKIFIYFQTAIFEIEKYIFSQYVTIATGIIHSILNLLNLIYSFIFTYLIIVYHLITQAISAFLTVVNLFITTILHVVSSISNKVIYLTSLPFIALNNGFIQIKPYLLLLEMHGKMAGLDLTNCFKSFEKMSTVIKNQN